MAVVILLLSFFPAKSSNTAINQYNSSLRVHNPIRHESRRKVTFRREADLLVEDLLSWQNICSHYRDLECFFSLVISLPDL